MADALRSSTSILNPSRSSFRLTGTSPPLNSSAFKGPNQAAHSRALPDDRFRIVFLAIMDKQIGTRMTEPVLLQKLITPSRLNSAIASSTGCLLLDVG